MRLGRVKIRATNAFFNLGIATSFHRDYSRTRRMREGRESVSRCDRGPRAPFPSILAAPLCINLRSIISRHRKRFHGVALGTKTRVRNKIYFSYRGLSPHFARAHVYRRLSTARRFIDTIIIYFNADARANSKTIIDRSRSTT